MCSRAVKRFAVVALLLAAMTPAVSLVASKATPYRSALATLGPSPVLAAGCAMQICDKPKGSKPAACLPSTLPYNCSKSGGHCTSIAC